MKNRIFFFVIVLFLSWTPSTYSYGPEILQKPNATSIPWGVVDWSPYFVVQGPNAGEGRIDRIKKVVAEKMPEFKFVDVIADAPRLIDLWKINKNACSGAVLKTPEREKWAYFTAFAFQVPHEYVVVTSKADIFESQEALPARKILSNKNLKGIFLKGRSYGTVMDDILKEESEKNRFVMFVRPSEGYMAILKMVQKGRYDYTFEYEGVVQSFNEKIFPEKPLVYRLVKESAPSTLVYFACTKNAWGKKIVLKVDEVLQKVAGAKEYQSAVESWLDPTIIIKNRKALDEFYHRRAQGPWHTVPSGE